MFRRVRKSRHMCSEVFAELDNGRDKAVEKYWNNVKDLV